MSKKQAPKKIDHCEEIIELIEIFRQNLYESKSISPTKFMHMQSAIHGVKNIIRDYYGKERKSEYAWIKN